MTYPQIVTLKIILFCSITVVLIVTSRDIYSDIRVQNTIHILAVTCSTLNGESELRGTVIYARGHVRLNENHGSSIKYGTRIKAGDEIITGKDGFVRIKLDNESTLTIQSGTQARLFCGEKKKDEPYKITRPYLSAAVRG